MFDEYGNSTEETPIEYDERMDEQYPIDPHAADDWSDIDPAEYRGADYGND